MPAIRCRSVDVVEPASRWQAERLSDSLLNELRVEARERAIAYRRGQWWTQAFRADRADVQAPQYLREGGVYLITGGLGRIGRTLAAIWWRLWGQGWTLASRSGLPPRSEWDRWLAEHDEADAQSDRIRFVRSLEEEGAEVLVVAADVGDREQMRAAVAQTRQRFGAPARRITRGRGCRRRGDGSAA